MNSLAIKVGLFLAWPFFAAFMLFAVFAVLVCCWPLILFGTLHRGADGKRSLRFANGERDAKQPTCSRRAPMESNRGMK